MALLTVYPHRFNLVCASVLVGCGQGHGTEDVSEAERTTFRDQARARLSDEAAQWRADLAGSTEEWRVAARNAAAHSLKDADLAGVRDEDPLCRLPAAEAAAWRDLWRSIGELAERADEDR